MPRKNGYASGKASRAGKAKSKARSAALDAEGTVDDATIGDDDGEPELAQPARKKARAEPSRKSMRGQPEKRKPTPRGPKAAKPKQVPAADMSPNRLEKRRERDRGYAQAFRDRSKDEDDEAPLEPDPSYGKSGASKAAQWNKKHRVMAKGEQWLESVGDEAAQAQALKDLSERPRKRRAAKASVWNAGGCVTRRPRQGQLCCSFCSLRQMMSWIESMTRRQHVCGQRKRRELARAIPQRCV
jgi:hypothetical protein